MRLPRPVRHGLLVLGLVIVGACSERATTPGFEPLPPADADSAEITIGGPCGAAADVSVEEGATQVVVSAVWRGGDDGACVARHAIRLDQPLGVRDLVDEDSDRRWTVEGDSWVSLQWCGVAARCEGDGTVPPPPTDASE